VDQKRAIKDKMNQFLTERPTLDEIDKQSAKGGEKKTLDKLLVSIFKKKKKGKFIIRKSYFFFFFKNNELFAIRKKNLEILLR
jgi:hypothetical protein